METGESEKLISVGRNGGVRPGAGRKPKAEKFKLPIAKAEKRIADRLPVLIDRMFELSDGVLVQEYDLTGAPRVYQKPPDRQAIEYLVNRILGKPTERQELSGPEGEPLFKVYERTDDFDPDSA